MKPYPIRLEIGAHNSSFSVFHSIPAGLYSFINSLVEIRFSLVGIVL